MRLGWRSEQGTGMMRAMGGGRGKPLVIEKPPERIDEAST
jgi:hypothetical protein